MAAGLVDGVMEQLGSVVTEQVKQEISLVVGVDKEVEKLKENLQAVVALLNEAEKEQFADDTVKVWLEDLYNVCYEMEDVVDEWNTELIKSAIQKKEEEEEEENGEVWLQVCSFIRSLSCCLGQVDKVVRRHDIAVEIKGLDEKLDKIAERRDRYRLQSTNEPAPTVVERTQTTSFVDESEIYGRDSIKDDLVGMLLGEGSEERRSPHLISLVGKGGTGKTTLAQLAYKDPKVEAHFEIKGWVCVSNPFDQCKVAKEILESIDEAQPSNLTALQSLLNRICNKVRGKKFLLVLDDVYTEDYAEWEPFRDALKNCGSQNSRILVTARNDKVAKMMESANTIKLEGLSEENCWLVFSKIAFFGKDPQQREQLEDIGSQISKKCNGLPLAAKTLGSLMRLKESREEWTNVLNNNLWELEDVERGLFAPLLLSYYDLSSPLKRCFSYCAVFPKNYVFNVEQLVYMWIAHGFVESKRNMEVEITAQDYFKNLVIRSFFQEYIQSGMTKYKMHDIVREFAQSITKAHYLEYLTESQFPPSTDRSKNLRTVIFFNHSDYNMSNLVQNFSRLRVLTLHFNMELPDTIGNLIHLRYLDLYCGKMDSSCRKWVLPETICNLCNLQFLKHRHLSKCQLPEGIGKLINLRLLVGFELVNPRGMGRLTSLRTLDGGLPNDSKGCEFEELKKLINLRDLTLSFPAENLPKSAVKDRRIALELPQDLEKLRICWYQGTTMSPIWLASLTNLKELRLDDARELMSLPPLGKILCLESLTIEDARSLKKVGVEFLGIESENKKEDITIFPNLKYLKFSGLWEWEEWIGGTKEGGKEDEDRITIMPHLQKLTIHSCKKLKSLPDFLRTIRLTELEIIDCPIIYNHYPRIGGDSHNISAIQIINKLTAAFVL